MRERHLSPWNQQFYRVPLQYVCPRCGAEVGDYCVTKNDTISRWPHDARKSPSAPSVGASVGGL